MDSTDQLAIGRAIADIEEHAPERDKALLLAALEHAPTPAGKINIASNIVQSFDPETSVWKLGELAEHYWTSIIIPFRAAGGKTPAPSSNPSRGEAYGGEKKYDPEHTTRDQSTLKKHALARDSYRCNITGRIDPKIFEAKPGTIPSLGEIHEVTQAAHIIPFALNDYDSNNATILEQKTTIWTALNAFSGGKLENLRGKGINSIDNVMTLSATAHTYFGGLQLALEEIPGVPNEYKVLKWGKVAPYIGFPDTTTLVSATDAPVPNPLYLALHCAICKVLWASGRAEYLEKILEDFEDTPVLAKDGGSAEILKLAMYRSLVSAQ